MHGMTAHVLITGHSRGLGAAIYKLAKAQGHRVMGLSSQQLNLADISKVEHFLESKKLHEFFSSASQAVLINNAGRLLPVGMTGKLNTREILDTITVNVGAVIAITNAFMAATPNCTDRRVVQISSGAARSPYAGWSVYCASKAALDQYCRCLAVESHAGLKVESLAPGIIDTDMQSQVRATTDQQFPMRSKFEKLKAEGLLSSPDSVAKDLMRHVLGSQFGQQTCTDLRQLS